MSAYVPNTLWRRYQIVKLELYHVNRMVEQTPEGSGMHLHWKEHLIVLTDRLRQIERERGSYGKYRSSV